MRYLQRSQSVAMKSHVRRDDRNAVSGFREREQRVRGAALEQNIRPDVGKPACRIERLAKDETGGQYEQRVRGKVADFDGATTSKIEWAVINRRERNGQEQTASEVTDARRQRRMRNSAELGVASLHHGQHFIADSFYQSHLYVGIVLGITMQECRKHIIDHLRRGGHFQYAAISVPEFVYLVAEGADVSQ